MSEPFSIVAVVEMNGGEALVLNRMPNMLYEFSGRDLLGSDGPFRYLYGYEAPIGRFKAFAGRRFNIPMKDGSAVEAHGQYWNCHPKGFTSIAYSTVDELQKCYVFSGGAAVDPEWLATSRAAYKGCVYPYWDYEKIIKYDQERRYWIGKAFKLERDKRHLIVNVKATHAKANKLGAAINGAIEALDGEPEYHDQGMGCGLEDRGITDRYEAMSHGWDKAMERVYGENIAWAKDALSSALKGGAA